MKTRTLILLWIASLGCLMLLFANTNPDSLPIGVLVVPIILLFLIGYLSSALLMRWLKLFANRERKRHIVSILCGLIGVFWVIVQSAGGVTAGDVILMLIMTILALFYVTKY